MDPHMPKAIGALTAPERPGAVLFGRSVGRTLQMGLPAFSIYGTEVQESSDTTIPQDVQENCVSLVPV